MKRVNKLAASVAVALSLGVVSQANALIEMEANSTGDALLFPVFWGGPGVENYFTIMNNDDNWIQGHLRFRGAVWCGEMLDMDIILSPGDVFVFRVADLDGDGFWEVDQSLDPKNFEYTGILGSCGKELADGTTPVRDMPNCRDQSNLLIPESDVNDKPKGNITQEKIDHHRRVGQIEFIAEGVFLPKATLSARMYDFIDSENKGELAHLGQKRNDLGTHLWSWVNGYQAYPNIDTTDPNVVAGLFEHEDNVIDTIVGSDTNGKEENRSAEDVGNVLSGTAFITKTGDTTGISYNADALINFRTEANNHRVENYPEDTGVILHHEDSIAYGNEANYAYVYHYDEYESFNTVRQFEGRISYANTWGPSLADGDDYPVGKYITDDPFDTHFQNLNSVYEVEEAVRTIKSGLPRQNFTSFYMDGATLDKIGGVRVRGSGLSSSYFSFAPNKFFYGEEQNRWINPAFSPTLAGFQETNQLLGKRGYLTAVVNRLINVGKTVKLEIWDIFENTPRNADQECKVSPCISDGTVIQSKKVLAEQVAYFSINDLKNTLGEEGTHQNWNAGRVVMTVDPKSQNEICETDISTKCPNAFSIMMYTFDMSADNSVSQWRPMHRGFSQK